MIELNKAKAVVVGAEANFGADHAAKGAGSGPHFVCHTIEELPIGALTPNPKNAKKHPKKQIAKLASGIKEFGFVIPIVVDENNMVLCGHARLEVLKLLGLETIACIRVSHLDAAQKKAFALADNKLAEDAVWDMDILKETLTELMEESDFALDLTGFETAEADNILAIGAAKAAKAESVPEVEMKQPPVSQLGDLWQLGNHKLLCGDARNLEHYETLFGAERARMVITDPPYNLVIANVVGSGAIQHGEFKMASGEMSAAEFTAFLASVFKLMAQFSTDGSIHYTFMDWRHIGEMEAAGKSIYSELKNLCVWNKNNAGLGSFYRSKHEMLFVWKNGTGPEINNFGLGSKRYRTNVWDYPGVNIKKPGGHSDLEMHPTAKPVALFVDAMKDCSKPKDIILDPFCGSGAVLIAAQRTKRIARAIEIDGAYVDLAIRRWENHAGELARHAVTGQTLDEVAQARGLVAPQFIFGPK